MPVKDRYCGLEAGADRRRHETLGRHELGDGLAELVGRAEANIAVGENAHEAAGGITDRHTADLVTSHQLLGIVEGGGRRQADRRRDHASLGPLDPVDFFSLFLDGQVPVQHTDPASSGDRNSERRLGHRVHRSRHERNSQFDPCDRRGGIDLVGKDLAPTRDDKHVVEGERLGPGEHLVVHRLTIGDLTTMTRTRDWG